MLSLRLAPLVIDHAVYMLKTILNALRKKKKGGTAKNGGEWRHAIASARWHFRPLSSNFSPEAMACCVCICSKKKKKDGVI